MEHYFTWLGKLEGCDPTPQEIGQFARVTKVRRISFSDLAIISQFDSCIFWKGAKHPELKLLIPARGKVTNANKDCYA